MKKQNSKKKSQTPKFEIKNIKLLLIIIILIVLIYLVLKETKQKESFISNINNNKNEPEKFVAHYDNNIFEKDDNVNYLYWTGGFDSTFRLCESLINEDKIVQPLYVSLVLDNDCISEETCTKLWLRRNRKEEKTAMDNIIKKIIKKFPQVKNRLKEIILIDNHIKDDEFNLGFEKLFYNNNLWPRKRKIHQYLFLSKYAFYHKINIDLGVLGIHNNSKLAKYLKKNLVKKNNNYIIENKNHPMGYLNFPLFGRTKEELLDKAKIYNYDDILKLTWSCWFPIDGKPCGKCPMCKERIVDHPK
jgi:hypothetical protein